MSTASATSRGVATQRRPLSISHWASSRLRDPRRTRCSRRRGSGRPCCRPCVPSPMNPIVCIATRSPSIVVRSSSVSSSEAASISGSTWPGARKPTIAPSTAGLRNVQAIATAPGVVSYRPATADRRSTSSRLRDSSGSLKRGSSRRQSSSGSRGDPFAGHLPGEQPGAHRRVHDHADPFALAEREQLPLGVALDQRVLRLERLDRRDLLDPPQLLDIEVRDADMPDQPLLLELGERRPSPPRCPRSGSGQWIW